MVKKEKGSAVNYAMYYVVLLLTLTVVVLLMTQQKLIVIKHCIENGVQICESYILADANYVDDIDEIDRTLDRKQIVTLYEYDVNNNSLTFPEAQQISGLALKYRKQIHDYFMLNDTGLPQIAPLTEFGANRLLIKDFIIYEAIYDRSEENIIGFIKYETQFDSNNGYISCKPKEYLPADTKINDTPLYGSTIFSTLTYDVHLFNRIVHHTETSVLVDIVPLTSYEERLP